MNFEKLLNIEVQQFITDKVGCNLTELALQKNSFPTIDFKILLNQIEAKFKCKEKLPTWYETSNIIYPNKISIEQTSSEITARYKTEIVNGTSLIDLTGGFGVDDYYFSKKIEDVVHCEINEELSDCVAHNFQQLGLVNVRFYKGDSAEILVKLNEKFDWIYVDPSRRNEIKGKVFMLNDCLPNVSKLINFYFNFSDNILIKTAPILDIKLGLNELKSVKKIHIIAVENEVKELLWEIEKKYTSDVIVSTRNYSKSKIENFSFTYNAATNPTFNLPQKYLYEPNSAIMKSGGFSHISTSFHLYKLHQHSHLYTSNDLIEFPGRTFEIIKVINYSKSDIKKHLENQKANVTTRNFPDTVDVIRKKWKIKDGGTNYCFFTTDKNDNKIVLICRKI
jgi:16S rRNA G966 N2-methylase RsmD